MPGFVMTSRFGHAAVSTQILVQGDLRDPGRSGMSVVDAMRAPATPEAGSPV